MGTNRQKKKRGKHCGVHIIALYRVAFLPRKRVHKLLIRSGYGINTTQHNNKKKRLWFFWLTAGVLFAVPPVDIQHHRGG